jgi:hypothetical protein
MWGQGGKGNGQGMWMTPEDIWAMQEVLYAQVMAKGMGKAGGARKGVIKPNLASWSTPSFGMAKGMSKGKGAQKGPQPVKRKAEGQAVGLAWKSRLSQAYASTTKTSPTKETFVYTTTELGPNSFMSTVSCVWAGAEYSADEAQATKKLAEESAAMMALAGQFPQIYEAVPEDEKLAGAAANAGVAAMPSAKKQKVSTGSTGSEDNGKSRLNAGVMVLAARAIVKGEVEYTVEETDGKQFAKVTINCLVPPRTFNGKPVVGTTKQAKKEAECNAADVAVKALQPHINAQMPAHEARKAEKLLAHAAQQAEKAAQA